MPANLRERLVSEGIVEENREDDMTPETVEVPVRRLGLARTLGVLGILGGVVLIIVGVVIWVVVASQLRAENITIPDDAIAFQGAVVQGPLTAYVQADIIQKHALEASGGHTYAELAQDDPLRSVMMNASFLRASLFTSVVSFGVAAFAIGVGILSIIFGWAVRRLASTFVAGRPAEVTAS